jgi:hypothetical protein
MAGGDGDGGGGGRILSFLPSSSHPNEIRVQDSIVGGEYGIEIIGAKEQRVEEARGGQSGNRTLMDDGCQYGVRIVNATTRTCAVQLEIDGNHMGSWVCGFGSEITLDRPEHAAKKFTFYTTHAVVTAKKAVEDRTATPAQVEVAKSGITSGPNNGMVTVSFTPEQTTHQTHVVYCWDRSGSMRSMGEAPLAGLHASFSKQKDIAVKTGVKTTMTLVTFDTKIETPCQKPDLRTLKLPLDNASDMIKPRGRTKLYDAVLRAAALLNTAMEAGDRGVLVVMTDGYDNESTKTARDVQTAITKIQETRDHANIPMVKCIFMGANVGDAQKVVGPSMGFPESSSMTFLAEAAEAAFTSMIDIAGRAMTSPAVFTAAERAQAMGQLPPPQQPLEQAKKDIMRRVDGLNFRERDALRAELESNAPDQEIDMSTYTYQNMAPASFWRRQTTRQIYEILGDVQAHLADMKEADQIKADEALAWARENERKRVIAAERAAEERAAAAARAAEEAIQAIQAWESLNKQVAAYFGGRGAQAVKAWVEAAKKVAEEAAQAAQAARMAAEHADHMARMQGEREQWWERWHAVKMAALGAIEEARFESERERHDRRRAYTADFSDARGVYIQGLVDFAGVAQDVAEGKAREIEGNAQETFASKESKPSERALAEAKIAFGDASAEFDEQQAFSEYLEAERNRVEEMEREMEAEMEARRQEMEEYGGRGGGAGCAEPEGKDGSGVGETPNDQCRSGGTTLQGDSAQRFGEGTLGDLNHDLMVQLATRLVGLKDVENRLLREAPTTTLSMAAGGFDD